MIREVELRLVFGEDQAVVAESAGVPLVSEERDEGRGISPADEPPCSRPVLGVNGEAVDPVHVSVHGHLGHVVPRRMTGKGEEIQVLTGDVDRSFERALGVSYGVVVVDIAPV